MASVLKTGEVKASVGSNPTLSARGIGATVAQMLCKHKVIGSNPIFSIALEGNNLSDTGVRLALPPFAGVNWLSTGQRVLRTSLNNIVSFRRTLVSTAA